MSTTDRETTAADTAANDLLTSLLADYGYTTSVIDGDLVATSPQGIDMAIGYDWCLALLDSLSSRKLIAADNANRASYRDNQLTVAA